MMQVKILPDFLVNGTKSDVKEIVSKNMINKDQISSNKIINHHTKQPTLHPEITQYFVPVSHIETNKLSEFYYRPVILGAVSLNFVNSKLGIDTIKDLKVITPIVDDPISVDWINSQEIDIDVKNLQQNPESENFTELPSIASKPEKYDIWKKEFIDWLYRNQKLNLFKFKNSKEISKFGESESNFRNRIRTLMRENRDDMVEKLRKNMFQNTQFAR
jgi:hypothetical protein